MVWDEGLILPSDQSKASTVQEMLVQLVLEHQVVQHPQVTKYCSQFTTAGVYILNLDNNYYLFPVLMAYTGQVLVTFCPTSSTKGITRIKS